MLDWLHFHLEELGAVAPTLVCKADDSNSPYGLGVSCSDEMSPAFTGLLFPNPTGGLHLTHKV